MRTSPYPPYEGIITIFVGCLIAVIDSSKLGRVGLASFAAFTEITRLVTDDGAPPELIQDIRAQGVEVLIA